MRTLTINIQDESAGQSACVSTLLDTLLADWPRIPGAWVVERMTAPQPFDRASMPSSAQRGGGTSSAARLTAEVRAIYGREKVANLLPDIQETRECMGGRAALGRANDNPRRAQDGAPSHAFDGASRIPPGSYGPMPSIMVRCPSSVSPPEEGPSIPPDGYEMPT
jgi:hypothetical protein